MKSYRVSLKKVVHILIVSLLLVSIFNLTTFAAAKSYSLGKKSYVKKETINNDVIFKGVFTSHSIYFNIEKWWSIENVEAEIKLSINQLVDLTKDSYITFNINGVPFYSYKIVYNPNQEIQSLKVSIPKDNLKEGINEFKIDGYSRITDKPCTDDINNANWIVIKKQSQININYKEKLVDNSIMNFPYPFLKSNQNDSQITQIVIPDNYTDNHLEKALLISAYLGKEDKSNFYKGELVKYSDLKKQNNENNIIFIGSNKSLPAEINNLFKDINNIDLSNSALIKLGNSPYKGNTENSKLMLIISDKEEYYLKAIKFLMNKEITTQISSDTFIIDDSLKEETQVKDLENRITFESLGFTHIQFKGPFRRTGTISYFLPKNKAIASGAKIKLNFRYSENLDFNRSLVTIYINDIPIGSKKLEKENVASDELEVQIPTDVINSNYIEVKIAFDLEAIGSYCEIRQEEMPWAIVNGSSYINLETKDLTGYFFNKYPSPFIIDGKFNELLFSVPDNLNSNELINLCRVFALMGKEIKYNNGSFEVSRYSNLNGREKNKNLIIYGTPDSNNIIKDLNESLWFKYADNYKFFIGNEKLYLTEPFNSKIASFQLDISPYNSQKAMLVVTSPSKDVLLDSLAYLGDSSKIDKLIGDSAIVDGYGNLRTFKFKKDEEKPVYEKMKKLDTAGRGLLGIIVLIIIFFTASAIMYFIKNKEKKNK